MREKIALPDLAATVSLAVRFAPLLRKGDVLLLQGDLGAGKTAFARTLLQKLGAADEIPSPTFTLVQAYELPSLRAFHFDLYRLKKPEEVEEIGFEEACADGLVLVEWPEKATPFMPRGALKLVFGMNEKQERFVRFEMTKEWEERLKVFYDTA